MSKEEKQKQAKSNYDGQEVETRKIGNQARLAEKVVEKTPEDPGCLKRARDARFASTGEPEVAPSAADAK